MSFLQTLLGLAQHHNQQTAGHAVQQSHPQPQASPTGLSTLGGQPSFMPPAGTSGLLNQLAVGQQQSPMNLGSPGYMSDPQGGFGMQPQNLGGYQQQLQAPQTHWQNMGQQPQNYVNPQVQDNGFYWYQ